ncbi:hypothetical protein CDAR_265021, partial [Caerostris darwini]
MEGKLKTISSAFVATCDGKPGEKGKA